MGATAGSPSARVITAGNAAFRTNRTNLHRPSSLVPSNRRHPGAGPELSDPARDLGRAVGSARRVVGAILPRHRVATFPISMQGLCAPPKITTRGRPGAARDDHHRVSYAPRQARCGLLLRHEAATAALGPNTSDFGRFGCRP